LIELFNNMPKTDGCIFPFEPRIGSSRRLKIGREKGHAIWDGGLSREFQQAVATCGLEDFKFHDLRHCLGSDLAMKGVSLQAIASILGHRDVRMSQRYSHLSPTYIGASLALLPPLTEKPKGQIGEVGGILQTKSKKGNKAPKEEQRSSNTSSN